MGVWGGGEQRVRAWIRHQRAIHSEVAQTASLWLPPALISHSHWFITSQHLSPALRKSFQGVHGETCTHTNINRGQKIGAMCSGTDHSVKQCHKIFNYQ